MEQATTTSSSKSTWSIPPGLRTFLIIWVGQLVSLLGTGMTWGGPKRRIHAIYGGAALSFMCDWFFAFGKTVPVWTVGAFLASFFIPLIMGNNQTIWQNKVPPAAQGRVFATSGMLRMASMPLAYLLAGPLADWFFEPAMRADGALAPLFGPLVGTGPGAGMALMFFFTGILGTSMALCGYLWLPARRVELDLPDYVPVGAEGS